jgi:hypothetical protein
LWHTPCLKYGIIFPALKSPLLRYT